MPGPLRFQAHLSLLADGGRHDGFLVLL